MVCFFGIDLHPFTALVICSALCASETSVDQSPHCADWASAGECERNPEYMETACALSCGARAHSNCIAWAAGGECERNPAYMMEACAESCASSSFAAPNPSKVSETDALDSASAKHSERSPNSEDKAAEDDCGGHPGGCRCYYDALAFGCPTSLGYDMKQFLCKCYYGDNVWFNVLTNFIWAFRTRSHERHALKQKFDVRFETDGVLSMDVGYNSRIQCGTAVAPVYPGTNFEIVIDELYQLAGNLLLPEVHNKVNQLCVPGRVALQLLCLHAELARQNADGVKAYVAQLARIWPMVDSCVDKSTPWPFHELGAYVKSLKAAAVKLPAGVPLKFETVAQLSWWPKVDAIRGKRPEESENHYWPCVPLQDRSCFPPTDNMFMSCEYCCDPSKGPTGEASCFVGGFTFARCCRTPGGRGRFY